VRSGWSHRRAAGGSGEGEHLPLHSLCGALTAGSEASFFPHGLSKRYSHGQRNLNPLKFPQATALTYFSNNWYLVNTFHIPVALNPTGQMQS